MKETKTFTVRAGFESRVSVKVARLNRRAVRLGVDPIDYTVSAKRLVVIKDQITGKESAFEMVDVTLSLNIPKLADWTFLATIQHAEGGNLLLTVPSAEATDLSAYRICPATCQHCNKPRVRKDTYVVRHDSGTFKQVGKDCLAHFTGYGKTPEQAAELAVFLSQFLDLVTNGAGGELDDDERSEGGGGGGHDGVGLNTFLAFVVAVSNKTGFRTRKQAEASQTASTKEDALYHMEPPRGTDREKIVKPSDEDRDFAILARVWAQLNPDASDFAHNMRVIASADGVLYRNLGIAAYIVEAYRRALGLAVERAARPVSKHFGEVGKRMRGLKLTYKGNYSFDSAYGTVFIHRFATEDGSDAIWKTGTESLCTEGETITVDASIKEHGEYKDRAQTILTRVTQKS